ncbi:hypothetical protein JTB14_028499 [Gonioctena quinquepunctata]|nr:hypothetical protein JTB14_028499 [Gonioctena quinquepunctata]
MIRSGRRVFVPAKNVDGEWRLWWILLNSNRTFFNNFTSVKGDLFDAPIHFALAHCLSSDFKMSRGIARTFKLKYKGVEFAFLFVGGSYFDAKELVPIMYNAGIDEAPQARESRSNFKSYITVGPQNFPRLRNIPKIDNNATSIEQRRSVAESHTVRTKRSYREMAKTTPKKRLMSESGFRGF